jgi:hypothetical protein
MVIHIWSGRVAAHILQNSHLQNSKFHNMSAMDQPLVGAFREGRATLGAWPCLLCAYNALHPTVVLVKRQATEIQHSFYTGLSNAVGCSKTEVAARPSAMIPLCAEERLCVGPSNDLQPSMCCCRCMLWSCCLQAAGAAAVFCPLRSAKQSSMT